MPQSRPKCINGQPISGFQFAALATQFLQAILQKNVCIDSTFKLVADNVNAKATQQVLEALMVSQCVCCNGT
jgi:hypothetical protein